MQIKPDVLVLGPLFATIGGFLRKAPDRKVKSHPSIKRRYPKRSAAREFCRVRRQGTGPSAGMHPHAGGRAREPAERRRTSGCERPVSSASWSGQHHHHCCRAWRSQAGPDQRGIRQKAAGLLVLFALWSRKTRPFAGTGTSRPGPVHSRRHKECLVPSYNQVHTSAEYKPESRVNQGICASIHPPSENVGPENGRDFLRVPGRNGHVALLLLARTDQVRDLAQKCPGALVAIAEEGLGCIDLNDPASIHKDDAICHAFATTGRAGEGRRDSGLLEHRAIVDAIEARDPAASEAAIREHIRRAAVSHQAAPAKRLKATNGLTLAASE